MEPDDEGDGNDKEDGKEGEEEPPATEAQKESQEAPQSGTQPPEVEEEYDESCMILQGTSSQTSSTFVM